MLVSTLSIFIWCVVASGGSVYLVKRDVSELIGNSQSPRTSSRITNTYLPAKEDINQYTPSNVNANQSEPLQQFETSSSTETYASGDVLDIGQSDITPSSVEFLSTNENTESETLFENRGSKEKDLTDNINGDKEKLNFNHQSSQNKQVPSSNYLPSHESSPANRFSSSISPKDVRFSAGQNGNLEKHSELHSFELKPEKITNSRDDSATEYGTPKFVSNQQTSSRGNFAENNYYSPAPTPSTYYSEPTSFAESNHNSEVKSAPNYGPPSDKAQALPNQQIPNRFSESRESNFESVRQHNYNSGSKSAPHHENSRSNTELPSNIYANPSKDNQLIIPARFVYGYTYNVPSENSFNDGESQLDNRFNIEPVARQEYKSNNNGQLSSQANTYQHLPSIISGSGNHYQRPLNNLHAAAEVEGTIPISNYARNQNQNGNGNQYFASPSTSSGTPQLHRQQQLPIPTNGYNYQAPTSSLGIEVEASRSDVPPSYQGQPEKLTSDSGTIPLSNYQTQNLNGNANQYFRNPSTSSGLPHSQNGYNYQAPVNGFGIEVEASRNLASRQGQPENLVASGEEYRSGGQSPSPSNGGVALSNRQQPYHLQNSGNGDGTQVISRHGEQQRGISQNFDEFEGYRY